MLGGYIGDASGAIFEYQENLDKKNGIINVERRNEISDVKSNIIKNDCYVTDDTIMLISIMDTILSAENNVFPTIKDYEVKLREYGNKYKNWHHKNGCSFATVFGSGFLKWLDSPFGTINDSWANGSAMRVAPIAYAFNDISQVIHQSKLSSIPSHNSKIAINGAIAIATCVFYSRKKKDKKYIKKEIELSCNYNLDFDLKELQSTYMFTCKADECVPQSIYIFLISSGFEDAIRKSLSIGGDTDTITSMVGCMAEAYYGIPNYLKDGMLKYMDEEMINVTKAFYEKYVIR